MNKTAREAVDSVRLQVNNFGPIVEADVELRPLTLFVGPSNSGKSYFAALLYALQRLPNLRGLRRRGFPPRRISGNGQKSGSGSIWKEVLAWAREASMSKTDADLMQIPLPGGMAQRVRAVLGDTDLLADLAEEEISRCFGVAGTGRLVRRPGNKRARITLQRFSTANQERSTPCQHSFSLTRGRLASAAAAIPDAVPLHVDQRASHRLRNRLRWIIEELESHQDDMLLTSKRQWAPNIIEELADAVFPHAFGQVWNSPYYLPADRAGMMHAHQVVVSALIGRAAHAAPSVEFPDERFPALSGVQADFIQQLITLHQPTPARSAEQRVGKLAGRKLAARLEEEILTGAVRMVPLPGLSYPEFFYRPTGWPEDLPLIQSSSMVSELAPVVLYLRHVIRIGDTLIIDEPEVHLHPEKQVQFVQLLARIVRAGVHVVMTTHSEWVLEELTNLVRASKLPAARRKAVNGAGVTLEADQVGAWLFQPKQRPKGSTVREISLISESGTDAAGYDDVATAQHNRWAAIANQLESGARP